MGTGPATRRTERSEATKGTLLRVARALFAKHGYAGVSTEEIVRKAGMTRGALYHHFEGKRDLFLAVFEALEAEVARLCAERAMAESDPWRRQLAAIEAFLDACLEPPVQRIALVDAPSVLGLAAWREVEERYGLALIRAGLEGLMQDGLIDEQPLDPLAHLILGALSEAGLMIARADDRESARAQVGESVERLLAGLRSGSASGSSARADPRRIGRARG